ncbi:MAG: hypothetical protein LQ346_004143 [Caloplaca aetnensis]|nr:MAG: hypothetical protein LQ346_004143 [Caloplaca aetnensis]
MQLTVRLGRSPCPGINALASHGYLPRNGLNISMEQFITGITEGLNFETNFTIFAVGVYQNFTTTGYNNTLNLDDLDHHAGELSLTFLLMGETTLYLKAMPGQDEETKMEYVKILFREERIPFNERYKRTDVTITLEDLGKIAVEIAAKS